MKKNVSRMLGLAALSLCFAFPAAAMADGDIITTQPQDVSVNYPEGCEFTVEVADEAQVESYQWYLEDSSHSVFLLDGYSAATNKLEMPSTQSYMTGESVYCEITTKDGEVYTSDPAEITILNNDEDVMALYIGNYVIEPGEDFDCSILGEGCEGKISLSEDGSLLTMDNVIIDNDTPIYDSTISAATLMFYAGRGNENETVTVQLIGENVLTNSFYQEESNGSGITMDFWWYESDVIADVAFEEGEGGGSLAISGGTYSLRNQAGIYIDAPICIYSYELGRYNTGIYAGALELAENTTLELNVSGAGLIVDSLIQNDGSVINIESYAPYVPTLMEELYIVEVYNNGEFVMDNAELNIKFTADPDMFVPYKQYLAAATGILLCNGTKTDINNSSINIEMSAEEGSYEYCGGLVGIGGDGGEDEASVSGSSITIDVDGAYVYSAMGVHTGGDLSISDGSYVSIDVTAAGESYGLAPEGMLCISNSNVYAYAESTTGENENGILSAGIEIALDDDIYTVEAGTKNGTAVASLVDYGEDNEEYTPGYEAKTITLGTRVIVKSPEAYEINLTSLYTGMNYMHLETVYDAADDPAEAAVVVFTGKKQYHFTDVPEGSYYYDPVYWAADNGITTGMGENTFNPGGTLSRAQAVTFIWRYNGCPEPKSTETSFTDIKKNSYYYKAVLWATENNITTGTSKTTFSPDDPCTRQQVVTFLWRSEKKPIAIADNPFKDVTTDMYSYDAIIWAYKNGITTGMGEGKFVPNGKCTRAQFVTFLYRLAELEA